jgi:hypothetical protein
MRKGRGRGEPKRGGGIRQQPSWSCRISRPLVLCLQGRPFRRWWEPPGLAVPFRQVHGGYMDFLVPSTSREGVWEEPEWYLTVSEFAIKNPQL